MRLITINRCPSLE